jgi:HKD family nuclease
MRIEVIDNQGVTNMAAEVEAQCRRCTEARLATASLTKEGIRFIDKALSLKRNNLNLKLLVGLYNGHTEPAALRRLLGLQQQSGGALAVRVSKNPRFHWKIYSFVSSQSMKSYIGSSNLTSDGLSTEGEVNICLTGTSRDRIFANITDTFDKNWRNDSVPLDNAIVNNFVPIAEQSRKLISQIHPEIRKLLRGVRRTRSSAASKRTVEATTMTYLTQRAGRTAQRAVTGKTKWDIRGWDWIVYDTRAERDKLRDAGSFYLADLFQEGIFLSLNDVRDYDDFKTEDGRYFIAYQRRRGSIRKRLNRVTLSLLKTCGFIRKKEDLKRDRKLRHPQRVLLNRLLRVGTMSSR